jgi:NADH:ubiquinone oxidoreductase subunit K
MIGPYLLFSTALFSVGAYGVLARRNLLIILMSLELMLNGINVALVAFGTRLGAASSAGQVFVLLVMAVAAAEVAVGLAIVISLFRARQTVDTHLLRSMGG